MKAIVLQELSSMVWKLVQIVAAPCFDYMYKHLKRLSDGNRSAVFKAIDRCDGNFIEEKSIA